LVTIESISAEGPSIHVVVANAGRSAAYEFIWDPRGPISVLSFDSAFHRGFSEDLDAREEIVRLVWRYVKGGAGL
jgi:hypothetical protein